MSTAMCPIKEQQTSDNLIVKGTTVFSLIYLIKGMFRFLRLPLIFLFMKSKGANFARACLIIRFHKNFLLKGLLLLKNVKTGFFCFARVGEPAHIETILPIWSRGSVAHCFNLLHNVRYRTTERTAPNR